MSGVQKIYRHASTEFTTVPNWVVRDPNYSPNAFRLLAYLLSHSTGYELTYGQIERQTTLGRYAINEAAKFLIGAGWLEWRQDKGEDGRFTSKTWILKDPMNPVRNDSGVESFHYGMTNGHIEENLIEKKNVKENNIQERELFDEFWKEYPRKTDKRAAIKAFKSALTRAKFEDILAGTIRYAKDPNLPEQRFIKYPASWLNADAWENPPLPPRKGGSSKEEQKRKIDEWLESLDG